MFKAPVADWVQQKHEKLLYKNLLSIYFLLKRVLNVVQSLFQAIQGLF